MSALKRWAYVHCRPLLWLLTIEDRRQRKIEERKRELHYEWAATWLEEELAIAWKLGYRPNEWLLEALAHDKRKGHSLLRETIHEAGMAKRHLHTNGPGCLHTPFGRLDLKPLYDA